MTEVKEVSEVKTDEFFNSIFNLETGYINTDKILCLEENFTFNEFFDYDKLEFIMKNKNAIKELIRPSCFEDDKNPFIIAGKYLSKSKKIVQHKNTGIASVSYHQTDEVQAGRYFAKNSLGIQNMIKEIRHTITNDYYYDIDMVNCHPVIISWLCKNLSIASPFLDKYIAGRDKIIDNLLKHNPELNKDGIKQVILSLIYGGNNLYNNLPKKTKWIIGFKKEIAGISKSICKIFTEIYNQRKKVKNYNIEGSTLSYIATIIENQLLLHMLKYFKNNLEKEEYMGCVLCFDGVMVRNTIDIFKLQGHISKIENLYSNLGIEIQLKIKEMSPLVLNGFHPIRIFDFNEEYYYYDFINELQKKNWDINELTAFVKSNINRVVIRLTTGEYFIKKDKDHMLEDIKKLPDTHIKYFIPSCSTNNLEKDEKTGKVDNFQQSFYKLIKNKFYNYITDYNNLTFAPDGFEISPRDFNTWFGYKATRLSNYDVSKIQPILEHIRTVWADNNEEHYKYIMSWFHHLFKYPNRKTKVALVLRSEKQQIGKGAIVEDFLIPYVIGKDTSLYGQGLDFLTARFNVELMNKVLVAVDEMATVKGDYHSKFDAIKSLITSSSVKLEIKGGRKFNGNNFMNFIMMTNNEFSIKVEWYDGRYAVFDCNCDRFRDFNYFNNLYSCFNQVNADIFYSYVYDLVDVVDVRTIPETKIRRDMKLSCMSSTMRFMYRVKELLDEKNDITEDVKDDEDDGKNDYFNATWQENLLKIEENDILGCVLYQFYKKFCDEENEKPVSNTRFGREINNIISKKKVKGSINYELNTLKLD
jgi:hypothetical protein